MQHHSTLNAASISLLQRLQHFQAIFRAADASGNGSLDEEDFQSAFKGHLGSDDKALRRMFVAIDSNCDGVVNWEEFSACLLLEKTAASAAGDQPGTSKKAAPMLVDLHMQAPRASTTAATAAGDAGQQVPMTCLVHAESSKPDRWYTTGSNGVVQAWNGKDLSHMRSYSSGLPTITAATYLPSSSLLAYGSYSRSLYLMDPATGRHAGSLPNITSTAALSLAAWSAPTAAVAAGGAGASLLGVTAGGGALDGSSTSRSRVEVATDYLAVGDADGSVRLMQLDIDDTADKKTAKRFTARKLWHSSNHRDWVVSVLHCPQISSVAAASLDKTVSLTDLEKCIAVRTLAGHTKPVHCCAWNGMLKVLASGSSDRRVLLWNPFSCRTLGALEGHTAPVVCLASNERDMQIISAAADNTVKVWDLRNQRCLQILTLNPAASALGGHSAPLSALAFSPKARLLVAGAVGLQGWALSDGSSSVRVGHTEAVSWVGYVDDMQEVVSTDHGGMVCCWDLLTGRLVHSFGDTHGGCRISTAALDEGCRRLITGAEDGSIKMWNFRSGGLLSTLSRSAEEGPASQWGSDGGVEVTGLAVASSTDTNGQAAPCIVATGWDRKVSWYADSGKRKCALLRAFSGPDSDVLAAAAMRGHPTLATACDNGEVWLWNLDSGAVLRKLVAPGLAARPQTERAVEALAFMHGDFRHVLVAVGADRVARFWDCQAGSCLQHDTGDATAHGESLCAVAVSPNNATLVTADTAGHVTVWDISSTHSALRGLSAAAMQRGRPGSALAGGPRASDALLGSSRGVPGVGFGQASGFSSSSTPKSAGPAGSPRAFSRSAAASGVAVVQQSVGVRQVACWRAHAAAVTALVWLPAPVAEAAADLVEQLEEAAAAVSHAHPEESAQAVQQQQPQLLIPQPLSQQQKQPKSAALEAAEGQQQALMLLSKMQNIHQGHLHEQQQALPATPQCRQQQQQQWLVQLQQQPDAVCLQQQQRQVEQQQHLTAPCSHPKNERNNSSGYILSAGLDRSMILWSSSGAKVGIFGSSTWDLASFHTRQHSLEPPAAEECEEAPAADQGLLVTQHSLDRSSCSSGSFSQVHESQRQDAAADAACTPGQCSGSSEHVAAARIVQHGPSGRLSQSAEQPYVTGLSPPGPQPQQELAAGSTVVSPRQPGSCCKAVTFLGLNTPSAAAAVAAAAADARLNLAQQQQQQQSASAGAAPVGVAPCEEQEAAEVVCLAAEEDIPTSLWLPEFAALSRPATAAAHGSSLKGGATARCGRAARPSSAAAALGGSLHSRAAVQSSVLAAAGRSSVALGPAASGGVWGRSKGGGEQGGAAGSSVAMGRPHSAGALQRREPRDRQ